MSFWLVSYFSVVILGSVCGIVLWYYFYVIMPLSTLPSFRAEIRLFKQLLFSKEKITTIAFQRMISLGHQHQNEGLFVLWFFKPFLLVFKEEDVKNVLHNNISKPPMYKVFEEAFGIGLFTSDEALWRKRRKLFNPVFRTKMLMDKIPIFNKNSKELVNVLSEVQSTTFVDVEKFLKEFSFRVINEALVGNNVADSYSISEKKIFIELADKCAEFINQRIIKPWLYFMTLFAEGRSFKKNVKKIDELIENQLISLKKRVPVGVTREKKGDDNGESITTNKSFAEVLLEQHDRDPNFTANDMLSEMKLFISAGYHTVSFSLNWCLFLLGKHLEVQDRVYEEIATLEGDVSFTELQHLMYMECVIMETLRLYPPIPIIARRLNEETQFGKYRIPKGTTAAIFVYMHHRDPKVFTDPNEFNPDRFLDGNPMENKWTNIAFSSGIRNCIGQKFAMLEMKTALVHILRKFKIISHGERQGSKLGWEVLLKTEEPLLMKFLPRKQTLCSLKE